MAPPSPIPCSVASCKYKTPDGLPTFEMVTLHLELHTQAVHTETKAGAKADGNAVGKAVGQLIQMVKKPMQKSDYARFCRKVPKYLYNLDPGQADFTSLEKVLKSRQKRILADPKNVFIHIKDVLDELRKYQKEEEKVDEEQGEKSKSPKGRSKKVDKKGSKRKRIIRDSSEESDESEAEEKPQKKATGKKATPAKKKRPIKDSSDESDPDDPDAVELDSDSGEAEKGDTVNDGSDSDDEVSSEDNKRKSRSAKKAKKRPISEEDSSEEATSSSSESEEREKPKNPKKVKTDKNEADSDYSPPVGGRRGKNVMKVSTPGTPNKVDKMSSSVKSRTTTTSTIKSNRSSVETKTSRSSRTISSKSVSSSSRHKSSVSKKQSKITTFITTSRSSHNKTIELDTPKKIKEPTKEEKRRAEKFKDEGNELYKIKDFPEALKKYNEAIELFPSCAPFYGNRSACYLMLEDPKKAHDDAQTSTDLDPSFEKGWARLARCSIILGDTKVAKVALAKLTSDYPIEQQNVELLDRIRGDTLTALQLGDNNSALYCMDKALELATHCVQIKTARAECLTYLGRYNDAAEASKDVLEMDKSNADAKFISGLCHYYEDEMEKAIKVFSEVLKVTPNHGKTRDMKQKAEILKQKKEAGVSAAKAGKLEKAYKLYSEAIDVDPQNRNAKLYFKRAMLGQKLKKQEEYLADCSRAIELDPNYTKALIMRAKGCLKAEKYQIAVTDFEVILKEDQSKEYKTLLAEAKQKLEKQTKKNKEKAVKCKDEGNRLYKNKSYEDALTKYTEAIDLHPQQAPYLGNRAACYLMLEQPRQAMEDAKAATSLDPSFVKGWARLLRCSILLGLTMTARQVLGKLVELDGNQDEEQKQLDVLEKTREDTLAAQQTGDMVQALACMDRALELATHSLSLKAARAVSLAALGRFPEAANVASTVLEQDAMNADANFVTGLCLYYEDKMDVAFTHFKKALTVDPNHMQTNVVFRKAMSLKQKSDEADMAVSLGSNVTAFRIFTAAVNIDPENRIANARLYAGRADVATTLQYPPPEIIADCETALELDPGQMQALARRGKCYMDMDRFEEAVEDFERVIEEMPTDEVSELLEKAKEEVAKENEPDYYELIGVTQTSTEEEIKKAFRKLSLQLHPDKQHGKTEDEKAANALRFTKITEAYAVLSDEKQRWIYDGNEDHAGGNWGFQPSETPEGPVGSPEGPAGGREEEVRRPPGPSGPRWTPGVGSGPEGAYPGGRIPQAARKGFGFKCKLCGSVFAKEPALKCHTTKAHR